MTTLAIELHMASVQNVTVTDDTLSVDLSDGRTVSVPLAWFPVPPTWNPERTQELAFDRQWRRDSLARFGRRHQRGKSYFWKAIGREVRSL